MNDDRATPPRSRGDPASWRRMAATSGRLAAAGWSSFALPCLRIGYRRYREECSAWRARRAHGANAGAGFALPYDERNPVVYIKDWPRNTYTDDYAMALASAGQIRLEGFLTSSSIAPYNRLISSEEYERWIEERRQGVRLARASGLRNIPDPIRGPKGHLEAPASGRIEDTRPLDTPGSRLIVNRARQATPTRPLLLVVCTGLTAAADAYLIDPTIADRVVVAWLGGHEKDMADYDGWSDGWAAYIVLNRLRMVQFPPYRFDPKVPKRRLLELPDTPFRQWMIDKPIPWHQGAPRDGDAPPLVSVVRRDYVLHADRVSFGGWIAKEGHQVPALERDEHGTALVVTVADRRVATEAWWATMTNPAVYAGDDLEVKFT